MPRIQVTTNTSVLRGGQLQTAVYQNGSGLAHAAPRDSAKDEADESSPIIWLWLYLQLVIPRSMQTFLILHKAVNGIDSRHSVIILLLPSYSMHNQSIQSKKMNDRKEIQLQGTTRDRTNVEILG